MATKKIFETLKAKSMQQTTSDGIPAVSVLEDRGDGDGPNGNIQPLAHPASPPPQQPSQPPCSLCSGKKFWRSITDPPSAEPTWRCLNCCVPPSPRFVAEIFEVGIDRPAEKNAPLPSGGMVQGKSGAAADRGPDHEVVVSSQQVACEAPVCSVCHSTWAIERTTKLVDSKSREETVQQVAVRCWSCSSAIELETFHRACSKRIGFDGERKLTLDEMKQRAKLMRSQ